MFILFGILVFIAGIAMLIIRPMLNTEVVVEKNKWGDEETQGASHPMLLWFNPFKSIMLMLIGLVLMVSSGLFFMADPGVNYMVQYPWGGQAAVTKPGVKVKMFGRIIPVSNEIVFKYALPNIETGELPQNSEYAYVEKAQQWEFNDAIKGDIATSVIVGVNVVDAATFIEMVEKNKSETNLVYSRIVPTIKAALKNSAKLMSAQEYLVGRSSDFDYFFRDQLENGLYRLKESTRENENGSIIGDTTAVRTVGLESSQPNKKVYVIMTDRNGDPVRQLGKDGKTVFTQYNLTIVDAIAEKVDWETKFDDRLDKQKELVAAVQAEKQEAEKEFFRAKKEEQAGEANKIKKQKALELIQIEETVAAETRAKSAKFKEVEQQNLFNAEKIRAKTIRMIADADAYEIKKKVNAGITPEKRLQMELDAKVKIAGQIAKLKLPTTYFNGTSGGGKNANGILVDLLGAKMAEGMITNTPKK